MTSTERIIMPLHIIFYLAIVHLVTCSKIPAVQNMIETPGSLNDVESIANTQSDRRPINFMEDQSHSNLLTKMSNLLKMTAQPMDCTDYIRMDYSESGVYTIWPRSRISNGRPLNVFCDMNTDNGGWTVLQRRGNFSRMEDYFFKNWSSYKKGFGDLEKDFWLGNDNIFALTNQKPYTIRFDLVDYEKNYVYAIYDVFHIDDEANNYRLTVRDYSGTANDSMTYHNGRIFSTKDRDNDNSGLHCATQRKGGWWYHDCDEANLNGYYFATKKDDVQSVNWFKWKKKEALFFVEMKIRPREVGRYLI